MKRKKRIPKPTGRPPINDTTKMLVARLYDEDAMTCKQIATACNISERSVYRIINERQAMKND